MLLARSSSRRRNIQPLTSSTVLVYVKGDRIGDGILKYPVIRAFRESNPDCRILWVTGKNPSAFANSLQFLAEGNIDEIKENTGLGGIKSLLKRLRFPKNEIIICTESKIKETLFLKSLKSKLFVSPALNYYFSNLQPKLKVYEPNFYLNFLNLMSLCSKTQLHPRFNINIPDEIHSLAREILPPKSKYVGLVIGAGNPEKQWPLQFFIEVAKYVALNKMVPVFFTGPAESELTTQLKNTLPEAIFPEETVPASFRTPLLTIALSKKVAFSLTNDSGGGHLVAAGGKKTITMFGKNRANKFRSPYCEQVCIDSSEFNVKHVCDLQFKPVFSHVVKSIAEEKKNM